MASISKAKKLWDKDNTTRLYCKLNNRTDADVLNKLSTVPSKQGYIKQLIRNDIAKEQTDK